MKFIWDKDKILGNLKCAFHFITWGSGQNNERERKKEIEKEGKVSVNVRIMNNSLYIEVSNTIQ